MKLRHIKIAGFKSFADPVTVDLERPFTGIVGPNGCGKSNIIDAVRWVLGEARLSELRGSSSMKELIFAGSTARKPLGRASVELLLSNEDGRIKGAWGEYAELTVKRVVTSDGQSQYFINQQQVRRRDVLDIFMGTGLGPRSYAIISQGMISSFIKAKPEELRVYLEEAAGVSLYRERRRETEQLIASTQTNLSRVEDALSLKLDEEARLKTEAEVVDKWEALNQEKRQAEGLWYFIQHEDVRQSLEKIGLDRAKAESALAAEKLALSRAEASLREAQAKLAPLEAVEQQKLVQLRAAEKALTLEESEEKRRLERAQAIENDLRSTLANVEKKRERHTELLQQQTRLQDSKGQSAQTRETLEAELEIREEQYAEAQERLETLDADMQTKQATLGQAERRVQGLRRDSEEAVRRAKDFEERLLRLEDNAKRYSAPDPEELERTQEVLAQAQFQLEDALAQIETTTEALEAARRRQQSADETYFQSLAQQKAMVGELEALEASLVGEAQEAAETFESEQGLIGLRRLHEVMTIDEDWVKAIDVVLGSKSEAIFLRLLQSAVFTENRPPHALSFLDSQVTQVPRASRDASAHPNWVPLRSKVTLRETNVAAGVALDVWLEGMWVVESLREALHLRSQLAMGEALITPEGDTVTPVSITYSAQATGAGQTLTQRLRVERLRADLEAAENALDSLMAERDAARRDVERLEGAQKDALRERDQWRQKEAQAHTAYKVLEEKAQVWQQRNEDLKRDRAELTEAKAREEARSETLWSTLDEAEEEHEKLVRVVNEARSTLTRQDETVKQLERQLTQARQQLAVLTVSQEANERSARELSTSLTLIVEDIAREEHKLTQLQEEKTQLEVSLKAGALGRLLREFEVAEAERNEAHRLLEEQRKASQGWVDDLQNHQAAILPLTETISQLRVEEENKAGLRTQFSERLNELGVDRIALAQQLAADKTKAQGARNRVMRIMAEIEALGPINHAAKAHLQEIQKTVELTRTQMTDLQEAIGLLEEAIRKIDQETRSTMRETFDRVRGHFKETFTLLFSGGNADLELVGDDLLNAGLEVRAQPPGKKNASLRMLSGGEQALTATALVFALFKLNPAPFCLLDEVDAPLDEANQARLANMCREQSHETQFLMITHHRITMEYAQALIGVTMREPGVSRVVSVDIDEAARIAN